MNTKTRKDFRDDDGDAAKERLFESVEDSVQGYADLINRIQKRAMAHGISSVVVLSTYDPLTGYSTYQLTQAGNVYQNQGAMRTALTQWEHPE